MVVSIDSIRCLVDWFGGLAEDTSLGSFWYNCGAPRKNGWSVLYPWICVTNGEVTLIYGEGDPFWEEPEDIMDPYVQIQSW